MLGIHDLWLFVLSSLALAISPGPDTAFIVSRSLKLGTRGGMMGVLGVSTGCFVHITAAAVGLSAILAASAVAFTVVKLVGAAYLCFLGIRMLLSKPAAGKTAAETKDDAKLSTAFWQGFLSNALNPKVALFFIAFLPQFINADTPSKPLAFAALGLLCNAIGTVWNLGVAWFSARAIGCLSGVPGLRVWLERVLGGLFVGLGVRLASLAR